MCRLIGESVLLVTQFACELSLIACEVGCDFCKLLVILVVVQNLQVCVVRVIVRVSQRKRCGQFQDGQKTNEPLLVVLFFDSKPLKNCEDSTNSNDPNTFATFRRLYHRIK